MATSGSVATYSFTQRKVIDHAARRAGWVPEQLGSEHLEVAQDLVFLQLSEYANSGFPLWTREFGLLGAQIGSPEVNCPAGTVDVLHSYWRIMNLFRGLATSSAGANVSQLIGGAPNADVSIAGPNAGVSFNFGSATEIDTIGILLGGISTLAAAIAVQTSPDGVTWTTVQTLPLTTYSPKQWAYFDLDPTLMTQYLQLVLPTGTWVLNQLNIGLANGQDIELGVLNIDDYYNLPNKLFQSDRANSVFVDRQISAPVLKIWPTPNQGAFYNGTVSALTRRYIQDPGKLTDTLEVPIRWYMGIVARLGVRLLDELPDPGPESQASYFTLMAKANRRQVLDQEASKAEAQMWSEERVRGPVRIVPNLRPYTV